MKDVLTQQCWFVSHSAKETRSLFDKFYQTNLSNFKAVTSELQSDVSVYDLEANAKHRKLKKKFAKQGKFQVDFDLFNDFALQKYKYLLNFDQV